MSDRALAQRRVKLMKAMSEIGVDVAVVLDPTDIIYFTGIRYRPMERLIGLVLDVSFDQATLVLPAFEKGRLAESDVAEIGYSDHEDSVAKLASVIQGRKSIGVQKNTLSLMRADGLVRHAGIAYSDFIDISSHIAYLRQFKDAEEVENLRYACAVTDKVLNEWKQYVRPGINERELRMHLDRLSAELGVDESCPGIIIASGVHSSSAHGTDAIRTLQPNEPIFIDCGARWNYYYCDVTRTFFTGQPNPQMEQIYHTVLSAQTAAISAVKPGRLLDEIDGIARNIIRDAGYGEYFSHRTGHGLGLSVHEMPQVGPGSDTIIEEGMVFTVEPGIYLPGMGGVRIEDDVLVTADGAEVLNGFPKDFRSMVL